MNAKDIIDKVISCCQCYSGHKEIKAKLDLLTYDN